MLTSSTVATLAIAACVTALTATGCNGATSTPSTPTTSSSPASSTANATRSDFNDADVTFLQMMYPHHAQAIDMAKMVPGRSQKAELVALAGNIEAAQAPEMSQMTTLLARFGKPDPGNTGIAMPGMMTGDQMSALTGLSGPPFDRLWMQMMIEHHSGAITMSDNELRDGANPDVKKMADAIISGQRAEIVQMRGMLGQS